MRPFQGLKSALPDSLYVQRPVLGMCENYGWKFIITLHEGSIPTPQKE